MADSYRRAVIRAANELGLERVDPERPGPGELLIAPMAAGICGTDLEILRGTLGFFALGLARFPITPGHEWAGEVLELGEGVTGFAPGDLVVGECAIGCQECRLCRAGHYHLCPQRDETGIVRRRGGMSERMVFPARAAHRLPAGVGVEDAALAEPLAVSLHGLQRCYAGEVDDTLIVGGGTIGVLSALAAQRLGAGRVLVVDPDEGRRGTAAALGLEVADRVSGTWPRVVEASGVLPGARAAVEALDLAGRAVLVGLSGATLPLALDPLVIGERTVLGSLSSPGAWPEAIALIADGLHPGRLVTHRYPLDEVAAAYEHVAARRPGTNKVLVLPNES